MSRGASINLSSTKRSASYGGLKTCGSPWACPLCSRKIWAGRSEQITEALTRLHAQGGSAAFVTLTMRHEAGQSLDELWEALSPAWRAVKQSKAVRQATDELGHLGTIRRVDVTHGRNGWHLHIHAIVCSDRRMNHAEADHLGKRMFGPWASTLAQHGCRPTEHHGLDVKLLDLANPAQAVAGYITSASTPEGMARELTDAMGGKRARLGNRTPWEILTAAMGGDRRAYALWMEWEAASKGKRALDGQSKLYAALGIDFDALEDDELAQRDEGGDLVQVLNLSDGAWRKLQSQPLAPPALLEVIEIAAASSDDFRVGLGRAHRAALSVLRSFHIDPDAPPARSPAGPADPGLAQRPESRAAGRRTAGAPAVDRHDRPPTNGRARGCAPPSVWTRYPRP